MTKPIDDGGPAFPTHGIRLGGMSLRDWFAGQALASLSGAVRPELGDDRTDTLAKIAYAVADAMIAHQKVVQ